MPVSINTRAQNYLTDSSHYTELDASDTNWLSKISKSDTEDLIGVYRNSMEDLEHTIVITSAGIHYIADSASRFIDYEDIKDVCSISHNKLDMMKNPDARRLRLKLQSGAELEFPVVGMRDGGGADIASFLSFLRGAIQTKQIEREKTAGKKSHD